MVGVFLSSVFKALKQKCFNSKIISSTTLGCISRPTSCRTLSVPGSSVSPAASTAGHRSTWTREFELSQVNCKTYLAFVNPSSVVNSDPSFNPHSFVVHGFRPLPKTPNFNEVFDAEVEGEWLKKQLSPIWRALNGEGSSSYWYYQSTHQGGFQDVFLSQYEYFNAVIKLYPKYNMLMILATAARLERRSYGKLEKMHHGGFLWVGMPHYRLEKMHHGGFLWVGMPHYRLRLHLRSILGVTPRLWFWNDCGYWFVREVELVFGSDLTLLDRVAYDLLICVCFVSSAW